MYMILEKLTTLLLQFKKKKKTCISNQQTLTQDQRILMYQLDELTHESHFQLQRL